MMISAETARYILQDKYGFDQDRAERAIQIAHQYEMNNTPIPGGYVSIRHKYSRPSPLRYSIEEHTGKVAAGTGKGYNQGNDVLPNDPPIRPKGKTMPARARTAPAEPAEETGEEDYSRYLDKDLSATMTDYAEWFEENVAEFKDLDPERILALGSTLYPKFQKSDFNIERREARRAERASAAESNGEAEAEAPRGRGRGRPATKATPAKATTSKAPPTRGRRRATADAGGSAAY